MSRTRHHTSPRGFRRGPRIADLMTVELDDFFARSAAAERAGDAAEALEYHSGIPMFGRSRHRGVLEQLAAARDELTPWICARWVVYQATRCEDRGSLTSSLLRRALDDAGQACHNDLMASTYAEGGDPITVLATVMGESWVAHQLAQDYGALASFLDEFVTGRLAAEAGLARAWVGAPVGGYRIEARTQPGTLQVVDLAGGSRTEVLDLGALDVVGAGGWALGRLVPSGTTPGLMFDTAPLTVDETVAREVAAGSGRPAAWLQVLADAIDDGRLLGSDLLREDYELMSDVPALRLLEFGTRPADRSRVLAQLGEGRDEIGRAAYRILRRAALGGLDEAAAPYVAAAVLNPHAYEQAQQSIVGPEQRVLWSRWAELVPAPARGRLQRFAAAAGESE